MWYISSRSSADERARISASVQRSRTLAMAFRASTMIRRTEQDLRSPQSSQGRNAVTEAHWNWGQRTIESAHDRADPDLMGRARESVAAAFAFLGVDEASVSELGQDMIEELFRDRIGFGDVRDLSQSIRRQSGQMDHGLEAVLPLLREHNPILILRARTLFARRARRKRVIAKYSGRISTEQPYIGRATENTKTPALGAQTANRRSELVAHKATPHPH